jgi:competence ComEA-like helix-hairpin-helix protein
MKSVMLFACAIACSLSLSVNDATGSQPAFALRASAFALRASARQANGSKSGEDLFLDKCSNCHGTERALVAPRTKKGWEGVLADMANQGAQLEPGEQEAILAFLTDRHGLVNVNTANAEELVGLGLSKKDADIIASYRSEHGPFADFATLQKVPGLDVDRLNAVRERVAFRD